MAAPPNRIQRPVIHNNPIRTSFTQDECTIYSYPSTGCLYVKTNADAVDLDFLLLLRHEPSTRFLPPQISHSDQDAEEDAFTHRLRMLGAQYFPSEEIYIESLERSRRIVMPILGWPDRGGVWMLYFAREGEMPGDIGRLKLAMSMDEKCEVMKELGATFCERPGDSPLSALFEEDR
jgi:hypothetical protein